MFTQVIPIPEIIGEYEAQVQALVSGELTAWSEVDSDPHFQNLSVTGIQTPEQASSSQVVVASEKKAVKSVLESQSCILIFDVKLKIEVERLLKEGISRSAGPAVILWVRNSYLVFAKLARRFIPLDPPWAWGEGVSPRAVLGEGVEIGEGTVVAPGATLERNVRVGKNCRIYPGVVVGAEVQIGDDCILFPNVVLYFGTVLKNKVRIHSGVVIGADGFGYAREGINQVKIPHQGGVILEDEVEVGPNSAIDRGNFGNTIIRKNVKIDNLCQIGHNADIGESSVICGHSGVVGSAKLGKANVLGAMSGIAKVETGEGVMLAAGTLATSQNIPDGAQLAGRPDRPLREWMRLNALISKLPQMAKTLKKLEKKYEEN